MMLQQTQTNRVVEKYQQFLMALPTVSDLAEASTAQVLALWQGLGYNRRGLYLQRAARAIVDTHGGIVPDDPRLLETLPGIGRNTAGAIAAFAYNRPVVFIETNIRRVFLHFFFADREGVPDSELLLLIERYLDYHQPRLWYYALMDYGAMLGRTVANPNRRSKQYVRQSAFAGSNRQLRGAILRTVVGTGTVSLSELRRQLSIAPEKISLCVEQLSKEGFVIRHGNSITIKE
ncbi:A/G-specific adenine glycosylase [Patescibacteria group bacterium]|nr:A/G-specific adenine glycosylase [Patescibacteria group bacterium]